jgi:signal transduction histidine kinase
MSEIDHLEILRTIDLFQSFSEEELRSFFTRVEEVRLKPQKLLFQEGDEGSDMYILLSGTLKVFRGNRLLHIVKPGNYVGEMAIIEDKPRSASVASLESCVLLKVPGELFKEYFSRQPQSLVAMMKSLSQRIRHDSEALADECEQVNILVHDMKNLIVPLQLIDVLERKAPDLAGDAYITCMQNARDNLLKLMERALAGARRLPLANAYTVGSLEKLLDDLVQAECAVHPDLGGKAITVAVSGAMPEFSFSELGMRRVLSNLLINAGQASEPGAVIRVIFSRHGSDGLVEIADQGCGIPNGLADKIFMPHFTTKEDGNGLGLPSCRQIIAEHGGGLTVRSSPGQGTTFTIRLPLFAPGISR